MYCRHVRLGQQTLDAVLWLQQSASANSTSRARGLKPRRVHVHFEASRLTSSNLRAFHLHPNHEHLRRHTKRGGKVIEDA